MSDSLARRLAGQSVNKAGLANDQTEINRIIAEASKGSKFYEAEKQKDAELSEKIARLHAIRDEVVQGVDFAKVEATVEHVISELESTRDLTQYICHVDCDAFYASVEVLDNPSLAGKAFGVGLGVLSTASYEARKYGVRSAMPSFIAKKLCPDLILVPLHFQRYSEMSSQVMDILRMRDPNMCPMSADEAYLNITAYCEEHQLSPEECVEKMRQEVKEKTRLTVSAGIAPNKMLAKICSDKNKPDGQYRLPFDRETIMEFMHDLPIRKVPGIGKVNERILEAFDIKTCGDIYQHRAIIHLMDHHLGLRSLLGAYMGLGSNNVHPMKREERKSVGSETTFNPTANVNVLLDKLSHVAESLADDLERTGFAGKTITLKYKLDNFKVFTRAKSCNRWITSKDDLYQIGKELFMKEKLPLKMRLIGLRATTLKDLRVAEDRGIGKFFEKAERGSPVKKKRKAEDPEIIMISSDNDDPDETFTLADQEKPNFFGDDDADEEEVMFTHVQVPQQSKPHSHAGTSSSASSSRPLRLERAKPVSAGPSKARSNQIPSPSTNDIQQPKQDDSLVQVAQGSRPPVEKQECPICSRVLETDNAGLNEHIDFCLSRGEIKRASAQGSDPDLGSTIKKDKKKKRANPFSKH